MRNYVIALYIRLSVEDFKTESLSIKFTSFQEIGLRLNMQHRIS